MWPRFIPVFYFSSSLTHRAGVPDDHEMGPRRGHLRWNRPVAMDSGNLGYLERHPCTFASWRGPMGAACQLGGRPDGVDLGMRGGRKGTKRGGSSQCGDR